MKAFKKHLYIFFRILSILIFGYIVFSNIGTFTSPVTNFIRIFLFAPIFVVFLIWNITSITMHILKKSIFKTNIVFGLICFALSAIVGGIWLYSDICLPQKPERLLSVHQIEMMESTLYPNIEVNKKYTNIGNIHLGTVAIEDCYLNYYDTANNNLGQISITYSKNSPNSIQKMFLNRIQQSIDRITFLGSSQEMNKIETIGNAKYRYRYVPDANTMFVIVENAEENIIYHLTIHTRTSIEPDVIMDNLLKNS